MRPSSFNIVSSIDGTKDYFIINLLSGHADILSKKEAHLLGMKELSDPPAEMVEKGYITTSEDETIRFKMATIDFLETRDGEEVQVFFVPTYLCNFNCSYCYQASYNNKVYPLKSEITLAFFDFIEKELSGRKSYVTLFGGEPLLPGSEYKESIRNFVEESTNRQLDLAVVTNGFLLDEYLHILSPANIREIQITLDGPEHVHNKRRPHKTGLPTFERISQNLDLCLEHNLPVNLRVVVDKDNIDSLPHLARIAIERGWTSSPLFKTQIGRNYELHQCQANNKKLFSRLELFQELYSLINKHPEVLQFHRPGFGLAAFLKDQGQLPSPLFDACPACKSEWALDYRGRVYSCTATVGKKGEELGSFFPEIALNRDAIAQWQQRDILSIPACHNCNVNLACGGGCGSIAKNTHQGNLFSPDCRPVTEMLEMGLSLYKV